MTVRFEGFVRAGFLVWDAENSARFGQAVYTEDNDGTDVSLGIGAAWHVTSRFGVRAEYEGAELDGTDLRAYSLGGLFDFKSTEWAAPGHQGAVPGNYAAAIDLR